VSDKKEKPTMWNGGKTNEVMNERIRKQINDFEHKYTEPTKVSGMGGVKRLVYRVVEDEENEK
tara:strand:- start:113 stop:301 length:189 start_codon:yes stop_codon:yes gene_type:complete